MEHAWIDIPEEVQDNTSYYRGHTAGEGLCLGGGSDTPALLQKMKAPIR